MKKLLLFCFIISYWPAAAQTKQISLEDVWQRNTFAAKSVQSVNWMKDGSYYTSLKDGKVVKHQVSDGAVIETLYDPTTDKLDIEDYQLSADEQKILLSTAVDRIYRRSSVAENYVYDLKAKKISKLSAGGKQMYATFSPDGNRVAFVRNNNIYVVDLANMTEWQITADGKRNEIINGAGDWVYEEELSLSRAFEWSPDSKKIAFYRFDESQVKEYNMQTWGKLYPEDYRFKYPKAGEANAVVKILVHDLGAARTVPMDIGSETDIYIARINWANNTHLSVRRLNRLQNKLEILHATADSGESKVIWTDESNTYIDIDAVDELVYLTDGSFITLSERSGFKHLYHFGADGQLIRPLTAGSWQVDRFYGLDVATMTLYFSSTEVSPLERHLYSLQIADVSPKKKGKKATPFEPIKKQLSTRQGTNTANFSSDFKYFILYNSSVEAPTYVTLHRTPTAEVVKVLEDNQALQSKLADYQINKKEFFRFKTSEGVTLNAWQIKPHNFDPAKKYPVLMFVYGGPGSQTVTDSWESGNFYWYQILAQKGYMVVSVDGRGTGARGTEFQKCTYKQLGAIEVKDQIEGAKYLATLPHVDAARIGIWGWSYGGYMSSLGITVGADVFKAAIAVAPVTSWRYYDTIYTERYLQTPQQNAAGYDDNSPVSHVNKLKGKYLLVHGTGDDNVHFQNAVAMEEALIKANKQFQSFYYPNRNHGIGGGITRLHLYTMMTNFLVENL